MAFGRFGRMGEGAEAPGTAGDMTTNLLNIGTAMMQSKAAEKIAADQAAAAKSASKSASAQAAALASAAGAQMQTAAIQAEATKKKWMWIVGGGIAALIIGGFIYYRYGRR